MFVHCSTCAMMYVFYLNCFHFRKINGVRICFRQITYNPSKHSRHATDEPTTVDDLAVNTRYLSIDDQRNRANSDFAGLAPRARQRRARTPEHDIRPLDILVEGEPRYPSSPSPTSPPIITPPIVEEVVSVQHDTPLASTPPPTLSTGTPSPPVEQCDNPTTSDQPVNPEQQSIPSYLPPNAPPPSTQYPPPGYTGYYTGSGPQYPPQGGYPSQPPGYQSQPYPPPAPSGIIFVCS